jgi:biopolymer transport protein ExbB
MVGDLEAHSPLGRVLGAGLRNVGSSREIMKEAIEEAGSVVSHDLERYLTTLGTIASISP